MKGFIDYNDNDRIRKRRAARMPARMDGKKLWKSMSLLGFILAFALIHIQIQINLSDTSSYLATSQDEFLQMQNIERDLTRQVAELRDPARIQRLATTMGMITPQEKRLAQVYSAPWIEGENSDTSGATVRLAKGDENLSIWAKLLSFGSQAEAKTANSSISE